MGIRSKEVVRSKTIMAQMKDEITYTYSVIVVSQESHGIHDSSTLVILRTCFWLS